MGCGYVDEWHGDPVLAHVLNLVVAELALKFIDFGLGVAGARHGDDVAKVKDDVDVFPCVQEVKIIGPYDDVEIACAFCPAAQFLERNYRIRGFRAVDLDVRGLEERGGLDGEPAHPEAVFAGYKVRGRPVDGGGGGDENDARQTQMLTHDAGAGEVAIVYGVEGAAE